MNRKKYELNLQEACQLLNEGISKGSWSTTTSFHSSNYTGSNTYGFSDSVTSYNKNPYYIEEIKLKEYALNKIIDCRFTDTGEMFFCYNDIVVFRKIIRDYFEKIKQSNKPYIYITIINAFVCISIIIIAWITQPSADSEIAIKLPWETILLVSCLFIGNIFLVMIPLRKTKNGLKTITDIEKMKEFLRYHKEMQCRHAK